MNIFKQATIGLLERRLVKTATVMAVRTWDPATFREIDLHMPGCDMNKWQKAQHMKVRVAPLVYRDYTPSGWDAETQTCTLYIDAAHDGPGSRWVKGLSAGDPIGYLGVGSSHQQPVRDKRLIFLGDETAIGHFFSLQQLAGQGTDMVGAVVLSEKRHRDEFMRYFSHLGLQALPKREAGDYAALEAWVSGLGEVDMASTVFYVAGYSPAVVRLRKFLRQKGYGGGQVKAQGFWN